MITFKLIRKVGKMLRGGAGKKEIFLGAFLGVLLGFNPTLSLTLFLGILITLLLNANLGFTLLGVAVGKLLGLSLSVVTFHTGYFIIHNLGLEGVFTLLANAPVTALMDLNVYSMIGSLPYALIVGFAFGKIIASTVQKTREQMARAAEHNTIDKAVGNKFSKFLMWLAFGKQKITMADMVAKQSPLLRKSGLILVGSMLVIGLLLQFLLLDLALKKGIQSAISKKTGAEVNMAKADFSLASGKIDIQTLEITDPDKPTHNLIQIDTLTADLSISDLLRRTYTIDLLAGSILKRDVERATPGALYHHESDQTATAQSAESSITTEEKAGKTLDDYLVKAEKWKKYAKKAQEYLKNRKAKSENAVQDQKPEPSKEVALADAKKQGYLTAAADFVTDRPTWTIRQIIIENVQLSSDLPAQTFQGLELSSHPELNQQATTLMLTPQASAEPTAKIVLHFEDPDAMHELTAHLKNVDIADAIKTGDSLKVESGKADISATGTFSSDALDLPFNLLVHDFKTDNSTLNSLKELKIPGKLYGSLGSPRVKVELDDNLKNAAIDAAKARATEEVEKAKTEAKETAEKEMNKVLESDDAKELKNKFKKLF